MTGAAARPRRALFLILMMTILALMKVERSLPQMRGQPPGSTRILRLVPRAGGRWEYAVLGHEGAFQSDTVRFDQGRLVIRLGDKVISLPLGELGESARRALPVWVGSVVDWVKAKLEPSDGHTAGGSVVLILHDQEVDGHV